MTIAVLGASFDPAHNVHLAIARNVLKSNRIQKVILMPVNIHPFEKKLSKVSHRLSMAKLLEEKYIEISDLELKKDSTSYSIDTLQALKQKFPKDKFYWIIGSDNLNTFTKWKDWQKIISNFGLIIVPRNKHTDIAKEVEGIIESEYLNKNIIILNAKDCPPFDISSSEIRERIKEKKTISNLVPKEVEKYIIQHRLYL